MASFEEAETEETVTCLHMMFYHPFQQEKQVFRHLNFYKREQLRADEVAKFGRDGNICHYILVDARVSRIQFSLQLFRKLSGSELCFEIKNTSKRTKLTVNNLELGYLNKIDLPLKCMVGFGDYQILMHVQEGESVDFFETFLELSQVSLLQEQYLPSLQPISEHGISPLFYSQAINPVEKPVEMDENEL
ncbi:TRAF-interacting protein with FHA domain-containing protein A [Alligator mississippiensis]|uniref:TRAF-interacting protein with FHA domain-containing protein A n=1 Tax=Alligator mississippiensis TaxID=8496 RepID=UPI0003D072A6|nr:TRAF-interacting protein with FHA domain-containing protein A [Alligator mississippiensis]